MLAVSMTEVRNALRCARIFALGRMQRRAVSFPVAASPLSAAFHRIVARFAGRALARSALEPAAVALQDGRELASVLASVLLDLAADEIVRTPSYTSMPAEADDLAEALRELAQYLAHEVTALGGAPSGALAQIFSARDLDLGNTLDLGGGQAILLVDPLDAPHVHGSDALGVLEYKATPGPGEALDQVQVALYRHLLNEAGVSGAEPVVLRFKPQLAVTLLSAGQAERLAQERVLPLLHEMTAWAEGASAKGPEQPDLCPFCPVRAACVTTYPAYLASRDQPPSSAARPLPDEAGEATAPAAAAKLAVSRQDDRTGQEEAREVEAAIAQMFRGQGALVRLRDIKVGPRLLTLELRAKGGSVRDLDRHAKAVLSRLRAELGLAADYVHRGGSRCFEVVRKTPRLLLLTELLDQQRPFLRERPGRFVIGEDTAGDALCGDLSNPASCHLLVGGAPGSGRSTLLRTLIASLAHYHPPSAIRFSLVELDGSSFAAFGSALCAHLEHPLCRDPDAAVELLLGLLHEMDERYQAWDEAGVEDLDSYNELAEPAQRFPRHVLAIAEIADLLTTAAREPVLSAVQRLGARARAVGIHLLFATQRPDARVLPAVLRTNLVGRIALQVPDAAASRLVLGKAGAERLQRKGDLIVDFGRGLARAQAAMLGTE